MQDLVGQGKGWAFAKIKLKSLFAGCRTSQCQFHCGHMILSCSVSPRHSGMPLPPCGPSKESAAFLEKELSLHQPLWVINESIWNFPPLSPWSRVCEERNLNLKDKGLGEARRAPALGTHCVACAQGRPQGQGPFSIFPSVSWVQIHNMDTLALCSHQSL